MSAPFSIVVLNPGSTSTKVALFHDDHAVRADTIAHGVGDLRRFSTVWEQYAYRLQLCKQWTKENVKECSAVVGMGGLLRSVEGGVYRVNQTMLRDARANLQGEHASNLGCALAHDLASRYRVPAYVVDPVSVDEFESPARYSGHPLIERRSLSHVLNIHAAARRVAEELQIPLEQSSFVIGHLGGGISIAPVRSGRIIDVNDAASDGPFSPERTGGLPLQPFITLCTSGKFSEAELRNLVMGKGGIAAYLGTNSTKEVESRIKAGDAVALEVYQAMAYQIAKEIGAMATVLNGKVNAIVLTGGIARSTMVTSWIEERVKFIAQVKVFPGEDEMCSLAQGAFRVLRGEEQAKEY
jgi:butyrate kinase